MGVNKFKLKAFQVSKNWGQTKSGWKDSGWQGAEREVERSAKKEEMANFTYLLYPQMSHFSVFHRHEQISPLHPCAMHITISTSCPLTAAVDNATSAWSICLAACLSVWCYLSERYQQHHTYSDTLKTDVLHFFEAPKEKELFRIGQTWVCVCVSALWKTKLSEGGLSASVFNFSRGFFCVRY